MNTACNVKLSSNDFLSLEKTEDMKAAFYEKVRRGGDVHRFWPRKQFNELTLCLAGLCTRYHALPVILFHSMDEYIGAIQIEAKHVLSDFELVWGEVEEDFSIATETLESGLCIEHNYYDQSGTYVSDGVYELTAWGEFRGL